MSHSVRTHGHLLEDTPWSPQRPAAATPGQGRWQPHSEVKQFPFPSPWEPPSPLPQGHVWKPVSAPGIALSRGSSAGDGGQATGTSCPGTHFLPWDDKPTPRLDTPLSACLLSLILFLPLASFSMELFVVHQQFMETVASGEEKGGSSQMPCPGPSQ